MAVKKKAAKKKPRSAAQKKRPNKPSRALQSAAPRDASQAPRAALHGEGIKHHAWRRGKYRTLEEFWPFYLHEHSSARNRLLHFVGSTFALGLCALALGLGSFLLVIPAVVSGYAFAWFGHFFIERNRPATFQYPVKSFVSDWRLWYTMLTGRLAAELRRFGIESRA